MDENVREVPYMQRSVSTTTDDLLPILAVCHAIHLIRVALQSRKQNGTQPGLYLNDSIDRKCAKIDENI